MRGRIVDRVGRVLADNKRTLVVTVDRKMIRRQSVREPLFTRLAGALGTTPEDAREAPQRRSLRPVAAAAAWPRASTRASPSTSVSARRTTRASRSPRAGSAVYRYSPIASHIVGYVGRIPDTDEAERVPGPGLPAVGHRRPQRHRDVVRVRPSRHPRLREVRGRRQQPCGPGGRARRADPRPRRAAGHRPEGAAVRRADPRSRPEGGPRPHAQGEARASSSRRRPARWWSRIPATARSWPWPPTRRSTTASSSAASARPSTRSCSGRRRATRR